MKRILLVDNYDSFTYNLVHYLEGLECDVKVVRNDEDVDPLQFDGIVLSPGPGLPNEAGNMNEVISKVDSKIPVLGVCLGMQGIAEYLDGTLYNLGEVKHGVVEQVELRDCSLFRNIPSKINVGLYHSWAVEGKGDFEVTSKSVNGVVMSLENVSRKMYGIQFHPESIMTEYGKQIISNFIGLST